MNQSLRILFIEDLPTDQELAAWQLREGGLDFTSLRVETQDAFLQALEVFQPDLIISDYSMPEFDGMRALYLTLERKQDIPFIVLTGSMNEETAAECIKAGASDYVIKEHIQRLPFAVQEALKQQQTRKEKMLAEESLRESENRYRSLFEDSPISLWEEDFSAVKLRLDELRAGGVNDFNAYFIQHPEAVLEFTGLVKVIDVNKATLELYGAASKEEMLKNFAVIIPAENFENIQNEFVLIASGVTHFNQESVNRTFDGKIITVKMNWAVIPGYDNDLSKVIVSMVDITASRNASKQIRLQATALNSTANAIVITDHEGIIEWTNSAYTLLTGYSLEEAIGQNPRILKSGHQGQSFYKELWGTILAGDVWRGELTNKRKDGSFYIEEMAITPLADENGQVTHFIAIKQDISARKQTEAAIVRYVADLEVLYKNSLKIARLFEKKEIAQCIMDLLEEQLHWHHAVLRLYEPQLDLLEVLGFSYFDLAAGQKDSLHKRLDVAALKPGQGLTGWVWQHNQTVRSGNLQADPRYMESFTGMQSGLYVPMQAADRVLGVISVESDLPSAFNEADERLLITLGAQAAAGFENARLYAETAHRMEELDTLVQISAAMRTAANRAEILPVILNETIIALHVTGAAFAFRDPISSETVFELGVGELAEYSQTINPPNEGITNWVIEHGQTYLCQETDSDSRYHSPVILAHPPKAMAFAPLISQNQTIGALLVGSQNYFEQNQLNLLQTIANIAANAIRRAALYEQTLSYATELEQRVAYRTIELSAANAALEKASRLKDEFLASMSHELRTPLTGILGLSESLQLLTYGELNSKQQNALKNIEDSGRHLLTLINDILDLSKIEAGKLDLQFDTFSVADLCQASLQLVKGMAHQKKQSVQFTMNPAAIKVFADARRLKQMLVNLLSNAVKFTPEGGALGLAVALNREEHQLLFSVWDKGIGIAPENQAKLFEPFVQIDGKLSRMYNGTGLGLSLVQRMTELHGGKVKVESTLGEGSTFTICLPWNDFAEQPFGALKQFDPAILRNVLVVENTVIDAEKLIRYLKELGIRGYIQPTLLGALEQAVTMHPGAIFIDLNLPDGSGLDLLNELKLNTHTCNIPIIITSFEDMRSETLRMEAVGYLVKPYNRQDLFTELVNITSSTNSGNQVIVDSERSKSPLILIADDNELILEMITDFFNAKGYRIVTTCNGMELIKRTSEIYPDIILVDIQMAGIDGFETIRMLRANPDPAIASTPIIAVTALAMVGDRDKCLQAGANEYLSKPIILTQLVEIINLLLKEHNNKGYS